MNQLPREKTQGKLRILVAPLDWGLGHATRCIPVIRELLAQGCEVLLAAEGGQQALLQQEFPGLPILTFEGYRINYAKSRTGLLWSVLSQVPKILRSIRKEHKWLLSIVSKYDIDAVIADNRYGLYHKRIPCIFITHQLVIKSPFGKWTEKILQKRNYKYINSFSSCWIPDNEDGNNLAGELSHPEKKPSVPVRYIGHLSRFNIKNIPEQKGHLLIILSGPEPQRTVLENKIVNEISHYPGTAAVIRGLPGSSSIIPSTNMIQFYNHLQTSELNDEMLKAEYVISRSGYSTVMDVAALRKKSILIPTPGQTEQEYLARHLIKTGFAFCINQKDFSLAGCLEKAKKFEYKMFGHRDNLRLKQVIVSFIGSLTNK